jgi:hypothetical protein
MAMISKPGTYLALLSAGITAITRGKVSSDGPAEKVHPFQC